MGSGPPPCTVGGEWAPAGGRHLAVGDRPCTHICLREELKVLMHTSQVTRLCGHGCLIVEQQYKQ